MTYTTLTVFDLDDTLIRPPLFTHMKELQDRFIDIRFNGIYDFYDHQVSLDPSLYDILAIGPVVEQAKLAKDDETILSCLITHRSRHLKEKVEYLLRHKGIHLDEYHYLGRVRPKYEIVNDYLKDNPKMCIVNIYEDSLIQINDYSNNIKVDRELTINYWFVDKTRIFRLDPLPTLNDIKSITLI
jgi:hypothetical protein